MEPGDAIVNQMESDEQWRDIQDIINNTEAPTMAWQPHARVAGSNVIEPIAPAAAATPTNVQYVGHAALQQSMSEPALLMQQIQLAQQQIEQQQQQQQQQQKMQQLAASPNNISNPATPAVATATAAAQRQRPHIKILEQPKEKGLRFRYICEGRSAGSIPGKQSTPENKTYPTVEIVGLKGEVILVISCVTKDPPYRPHPHRLVSKDGQCKDGICSIKLTQEPLRCVISNVGIQCVKKRDIRDSLLERERRNIDPFKTKFEHKDQPNTIDLNVVRLCFQAFYRGPNGIEHLEPVVSTPIYEKKANNDLTINRLCSCSAKVAGGDEIIMLCDKVAKDDIKIRFFELNRDEEVCWESFAEFQQSDVHKQTAIAFKTPRYHSTDVKHSVKAYLQLYRPSDKQTSEPLPFEYYPDPDSLKRKRTKLESTMTILERELQKYAESNYREASPNHLKPPSVASYSTTGSPSYVSEIKAETNYHDMDMHSNVSSTSPYPYLNNGQQYPASPASSYATGDSMQPTQMTQQNIGMYLGFCEQMAGTNSVATSFNGGTMTPLNNYNSNNNNNNNTTTTNTNNNNTNFDNMNILLGAQSQQNHQQIVTKTNFTIEAENFQREFSQTTSLTATTTTTTSTDEQQLNGGNEPTLSGLLNGSGPSLSGLLEQLDCDDLFSGMSLKTDDDINFK